MVIKGRPPEVGRDGEHRGQLTYLVSGERPTVFYRSGGVCNTQTLLLRNSDDLGLNPVIAAAWYLAAEKGDEDSREWVEMLLEKLGCAQSFEPGDDQLRWILVQLAGQKGAEQSLLSLDPGPDFGMMDDKYHSMPSPWIAGRFSSN